MLRENSKFNTIEVPINRGFSYKKKRRTLREKTLLTLCQNRESPLKFTRIPLFIKAYSYFFKSKWDFSFNLVWDQANDPRIKSSAFNYSFNLETSNHDSRSSFIAPLDHNVSWRSNQRNLLYSFIVKIHTEDCIHIYIYIQIQIDYLLHYFVTYDLSFMKIVCTVEVELQLFYSTISDFTSLANWNPLQWRHLEFKRVPIIWLFLQNIK